jgi:hypothetical protein
MGDVFQKQRFVNENLGKNYTRLHAIIYAVIEERFGKTKKCMFGLKRGSQTGVTHEGCVDVSIWEFELYMKYVHIHENNVVTITKGDALQTFCKSCSRRRRKARLEQQKQENEGKSPYEIRARYMTKYGKDTKECSRCKRSHHIDLFNVSPGMECGLHNMCKSCSCEYGSSVGDRWIRYLPDGNHKYDKAELKDDMHDDHIFPLSLGGSNDKINHQMISSTENLKKGSGLDHFTSMKDIHPDMLSARFRHHLQEAQDIMELKIRLHESMYAEICERSRMSNEELFEMYKRYTVMNNLNVDVARAVKKFREDCKIRNIC